MGAARRLQNEIEAVLKKVKEGVASFDDTHAKVCVNWRLRVSIHVVRRETTLHSSAAFVVQLAQVRNIALNFVPISQQVFGFAAVDGTRCSTAERETGCFSKGPNKEAAEGPRQN